MVILYLAQNTSCFFILINIQIFFIPVVKPVNTGIVFKRSGYIPVKNFLNISFFGISGYTWVMQSMSRMRSPRPAESRSFLVKGWIFWIFLPPSEQKKGVTQSKHFTANPQWINTFESVLLIYITCTYIHLGIIIINKLKVRETFPLLQKLFKGSWHDKSDLRHVKSK